MRLVLERQAWKEWKQIKWRAKDLMISLERSDLCKYNDKKDL